MPGDSIYARMMNPLYPSPPSSPLPPHSPPFSSPNDASTAQRNQLNQPMNHDTANRVNENASIPVPTMTHEVKQPALPLYPLDYYTS